MKRKSNDDNGSNPPAKKTKYEDRDRWNIVKRTTYSNRERKEFQQQIKNGNFHNVPSSQRDLYMGSQRNEFFFIPDVSKFLENKNKPLELIKLLDEAERSRQIQLLSVLKREDLKKFRLFIKYQLTKINNKINNEGYSPDPAWKPFTIFIDGPLTSSDYLTPLTSKDKRPLLTILFEQRLTAELFDRILITCPDLQPLENQYPEDHPLVLAAAGKWDRLKENLGNGKYHPCQFLEDTIKPFSNTDGSYENRTNLDLKDGQSIFYLLWNAGQNSLLKVVRKFLFEDPKNLLDAIDSNTIRIEKTSDITGHDEYFILIKLKKFDIKKNKSLYLNVNDDNRPAEELLKKLKRVFENNSFMHNKKPSNENNINPFYTYKKNIKFIILYHDKDSGICKENLEIIKSILEKPDLYIFGYDHLKNLVRKFFDQIQQENNLEKMPEALVNVTSIFLKP